MCGLYETRAGLGHGINLTTLTLFVQECTPTSARGTCACFQVCFCVVLLIVDKPLYSSVAFFCYTIICRNSLQEFTMMFVGMCGLILGMDNVLGTHKGIAYLALSPIVGDVLMLLLLLVALKESPKYVVLLSGEFTLR